MAGASNGLFNTGTATIVVGDINDNPPTFLKTPVSDQQIQGCVSNCGRISALNSPSLVRRQREGK